MTRAASRETLERLAEASVSLRLDPDSLSKWDDFALAENAYRAEIAPLRTRAEVDAEIAAVVRDWCHAPLPSMLDILGRLCAESTAPEPLLSPAEVQTCGCKESLALRRKLELIGFAAGQARQDAHLLRGTTHCLAEVAVLDVLDIVERENE